jgi:hypothetical protein
MSVGRFQTSIRHNGKALINQWPTPELSCQRRESLERNVVGSKELTQQVDEGSLASPFWANDEEDSLLRGIWRQEVAENLLKGISFLPVLRPPTRPGICQTADIRGRRVVAGQAGCREQQRRMLRERPRSQIQNAVLNYNNVLGGSMALPQPARRIHLRVYQNEPLQGVLNGPNFGLVRVEGLDLPLFGYDNGGSEELIKSRCKVSGMSSR